MAKRPANPNSKYGRRRLRQEYDERRAAMTPQERSDLDSQGCLWTGIILFVIMGLILWIGGPDALIRWLT